MGLCMAALGRRSSANIKDVWLECAKLKNNPHTATFMGISLLKRVDRYRLVPSRFLSFAHRKRAKRYGSRALKQGVGPRVTTLYESGTDSTLCHCRNRMEYFQLREIETSLCHSINSITITASSRSPPQKFIHVVFSEILANRFPNRNRLTIQGFPFLYLLCVLPKIGNALPQPGVDPRLPISTTT